jgi:hypothetical protein
MAAEDVEVKLESVTPKLETPTPQPSPRREPTILPTYSETRERASPYKTWTRSRSRTKREEEEEGKGEKPLKKSSRGNRLIEQTKNVVKDYWELAERVSARLGEESPMPLF